MPVTRTFTHAHCLHEPGRRRSVNRPEPEYAGTLNRMRGELRMLIRDQLRAASGRSQCMMHWTPHGYARSIVFGRGQWLEGWPNDPDGENIPFGDLSSIPGGQPIISRLLDLWKTGKLYFRPATDEEKRLAWRNPEAVLPGRPVERPEPRSLGPYGRNDIGRPRSQPKIFDADGKPVGRRWKRLGAITPKLCLQDEIVDPEEELLSDDEADLASAVGSDPIENWSDA